MHGVRLEIVPVADVMPHEIADPGRERRIEQRLREDRMLRDPLMVGDVPDVDGYVLLDGTNRLRALTGLGLPWVMAQVLDYADYQSIELRSWCHLADVAVGEIVSRAWEIPGLEIEALPPLAAPDVLGEHDTLAVLFGAHERTGLRRVAGSPPRAQQLRALVDLYEDRMTRVDCDPENVEEQAKRLARLAGHPVALVAFPVFSRSQVVAMAMQGTPIPAGITRHLVRGGRALRVNLPLDVLGAPQLEDAREALTAHVGELHPRTYREPTILFDS